MGIQDEILTITLNLNIDSSKITCSKRWKVISFIFIVFVTERFLKGWIDCCFYLFIYHFLLLSKYICLHLPTTTFPCPAHPHLPLNPTPIWLCPWVLCTCSLMNFIFIVELLVKYLLHALYCQIVHLTPASCTESFMWDSSRLAEHPHITLVNSS